MTYPTTARPTSGETMESRGTVAAVGVTREVLRKKIGGYIDAIRLGATDEGITNAIMRELASFFPAPDATVSEPVAGQALPYATPQELVAAFKSGTKFVLHYHGRAFDVTHMEARARVVYVQPPGLAVKVLPDGSSAEGDSGGIWLASPASARDAVIEECREKISNLRISEAGLFDAKHSGQRGQDRSDALYDAYQALRSLAQGAKP